MTPSKKPTPKAGAAGNGGGSSSKSVFAGDHDKIWSHQFATTLEVTHIVGGTPSDPRVVEGWLRTRLLGQQGRDQELYDRVAEILEERGLDDKHANEVIPDLAKTTNVNGFRRRNNVLQIEGRQIKAALKEACSVAVAGGHLKAKGWGVASGNKGLLSFAAEHIMVPEMWVSLLDEDEKPITEPSGIQQRFVQVFRGRGIAYEEYVDTAILNFTVKSDWDFKPEEWRAIWLIAQEQGIGATRSQGYGRYLITKWDEIT